MQNNQCDPVMYRSKPFIYFGGGEFRTAATAYHNNVAPFHTAVYQVKSVLLMWLHLYYKKCTLEKSLCSKKCSLATLQLSMYQKRSRQTAGCVEFNELTVLHVWRSNSLTSFSQLSSLHKAHSLRRKKRRNMLAIFGFRKNRNQTLSNQGPESEAEVYGDGCHFVASAPTGFVYAQTRRSHTPFRKVWPWKHNTMLIWCTR